MGLTSWILIGSFLGIFYILGWMAAVWVWAELENDATKNNGDHDVFIFWAAFLGIVWPVQIAAGLVFGIGWVLIWAPLKWIKLVFTEKDRV